MRPQDRMTIAEIAYKKYLEYMQKKNDPFELPSTDGFSHAVQQAIITWEENQDNWK
ncbi:MAG: hypothetical protein Q7R33_02875 [Nitrosarchaeum sp.]|nr:hypothetical protein [Nitrosarchaeum sp.]